MMYPYPNIVAPLVGAWIEIPKFLVYVTPPLVAPLVGAWIEMLLIFET